MRNFTRFILPVLLSVAYSVSLVGQEEVTLVVHHLEQEGGLLGVGREVPELPVLDYWATAGRWNPEHFHVPARDGDHPEGFYGTIIERKYSAVVVGPGVVLTAAHNVWNDWEGKLKPPYSACTVGPKERCLPKDILCCDVHPAWPGNSTADLALCRTSKFQSLGNYEIVNLSSELEGSADYVVLYGYGGDCSPTTSDIDGNLSFKKVDILQRPAETHLFLEVDSCLCPGDSGGPAMYRPPGGQRVVLGINSQRGCWYNTYEFAQLSSTQAVASWIRDWTEGQAEGQTCGKDEPVKVCGVNLTREEQVGAGLKKGLCGL